ncbi:hypothetical protein MNB_SV-3-1127 [hydrothermal vent metagenome]|uniref:TraG N-terminal Proteobacteria domain-containing protein n=1 Tax=hydrothermal vent metagenome TaxID=652676 RepID=A0A1W1BX24_9ZZZZ
MRGDSAQEKKNKTARKDNKKKRSIKKTILLFFILGVVFVVSMTAVGAISSVNGSIVDVGSNAASWFLGGATIEGFLHPFAHSIAVMRMIEGWGIYYGQRLASSVHGGFLYWVAFIMFIWGLYRHLMPSGVEIIARSEAEYFTEFVLWIAYFGIMLLLLGQPWTSKFNLLRMSTSIADRTTDELVSIFNGFGSRKAADVVTSQLKKLGINQALNVNNFSPALSTELADFISQCGAKNTGVAGIGVLDVAFSKTDSLYSNLKAYRDGKVINCETWKQHLREEIAKAVESNLKQTASNLGVPASDLISRAERIGKKIFDQTIIPAYYSMEQPTVIAGGAGALYNGTPTSEEELVAYALEDSNMANTAYEKTLSNVTYGVDMSPINAHLHFSLHNLWWWLTHPGYIIWGISGLFKTFIGSAIVYVFQLITRYFLPFVVQGIYIVNSVLYALLIMFLPLVVVLALADILDIMMVVKYLFVMIWMRSWVVPVSIIVNLYVNYLDTSAMNFVAPLVTETLIFMAPSVMAIILLQGNAIITKISTGVEDVKSSVVRFLSIASAF